MTQAPLPLLVRTACVVAGLLVGPFINAAAANVVNVPGNYPTIQAAINAVVSNVQPDGTTINVQSNTYFESLNVSGSSRSFTVTGVGGPVIVDAAGTGLAAVTVVNATGNVVFQGLTFRHGAVPQSGTNGGGFYIRSSSPSFVNCIFELSSAFNGGGGYLYASSATFTGCIIRNNSAAHFGGGVFINAGGHPVFTNCSITGNASGTGTFDGAGGGVNTIDASPTFISSYIHGNTSKFAAGGVFHQGAFGSLNGRSMLVMTDTEVSDNISTRFSPAYNPAEGGGVHVEDNATATLTRVRILRNQAGTGGGLNAYRSRYDIVDSVIDANQARADGGFGGGIAATSNFATSGMPASIINLTGTLVRNNLALAADGGSNASAGGIAVIGYNGFKASLMLSGSVVDANQSLLQGGGILVSTGDLTITNSLIIRNTLTGASAANGGGINVNPNATATISGSTIAHNTAAGANGFGGGMFIDGGTAININGANIYDNAASSRGGGVFNGNTAQSGTIQNSIIADNSNGVTQGQIREDFCSSVLYQNNTITGLSDPTQFSGCAGPPLTSRTTGNNSNVPRFAQFLAVPGTDVSGSGTASTLAWSVGRATSVNIPGAGAGTWNVPTGTVDVTPIRSTNYRLTASTASGPIGPVTAGVIVLGATSRRIVDGDFNGDGKADFTIFRPSNGTWYTQYSGTGTTSGVQWGNGNDLPVPGDYDGDGKTDIAVFRPSNGTWYILYSGTGAIVSVQFGNGLDVPVPGDYDGDGKTDIAVFRPSNGTWYIAYSSTGATGSVQWGNGNDKPVPGDYDGDGRTDVAIFRPSNGTWYVVYSSTGATVSVSWGNGNDKPVPGDYDGDGKTDIAIFRPSNGTWYVVYSSTGATGSVQWGNGNDEPVPGDYDGDGKTDIAIFRPSNGTWNVVYSSTATTGSIPWGNGNDIPILKR